MKKILKAFQNKYPDAVSCEAKCDGHIATSYIRKMANLIGGIESTVIYARENEKSLSIIVSRKAFTEGVKDVDLEKERD
jgi:hypothetical protein